MFSFGFTEAEQQYPVSRRFTLSHWLVEFLHIRQRAVQKRHIEDVKGCCPMCIHEGQKRFVVCTMASGDQRMISQKQYNKVSPGVFTKKSQEMPARLSLLPGLACAAHANHKKQSSH